MSLKWLRDLAGWLADGGTRRLTASWLVATDGVKQWQRKCAYSDCLLKSLVKVVSVSLLPVTPCYHTPVTSCYLVLVAEHPLPSPGLRDG
ncbi:hypothetical protein FHG87_021943 [Trinorchestia longiramus]|nr:hypothetical protein FHG87_021943 [Trinorchestia longiramus]